MYALKVNKFYKHAFIKTVLGITAKISNLQGAPQDDGVCFIEISQGNQKLRQLEYRNFSPIFGRATLYKCITAGCEMWHQNAWF